MTPAERKAIAIADAKWWDMIQANHGSGRGVPDQGHMQATAALAALSVDGPVIIVDGKVAGLDETVRKLTDAAWSDFPVGPPAHIKDRNHQAWLSDLIDAAREVAE